MSELKEIMLIMRFDLFIPCPCLQPATGREAGCADTEPVVMARPQAPLPGTLTLLRGVLGPEQGVVLAGWAALQVRSGVSQRGQGTAIMPGWADRSCF